MDPYEYLFSRLQLKFEELPDSKNLMIKKFGLYFDSKFICNFNYCQTVKDLFLYLNDQKTLISHWIREIVPVVKLLRQFPRELESQEHVDLLLTLNGMNIGA